MAEASEDANRIEKIYECGERLNQVKDKSQNADDYENIIKAAQSSSVKARQLAAMLIPRFFKYFPGLSVNAVDAQIDLCEAEELEIRIEAIRGLPLFCKDTPEHLSKIVDILAQLLTAEERMECDAVNKALMSLLRQDVKAFLTALFKHIESVNEQITDENLREKIFVFIRDKVFPRKTELLKPLKEMERFITDLIKQSLQDVTGFEFKVFMDFLESLTMFGEKAPSEQVQELIEIIEDQADLAAEFEVADGDQCDRLTSCLFIALPFFERRASNSKFYQYLNKHIFPVFDELSVERKVNLLKNLAESSPYTSPQDSRQILPAIVLLLKNYMPRRKIVEETNFTSVECLLYTFHHLAHKTPNATNSLCGYKIVTGQPSDRLGEDFSEQYKDFTVRLNCVEDIVRATETKLSQGMSNHNKALASAISDETKASITTQKQDTAIGLRTCSNILAMTRPLLSKTPIFITDKSFILSWKEPVKSSAPSSSGYSSEGERRHPLSAPNDSDNNPSRKRWRNNGMQRQVSSRKHKDASYNGWRHGSWSQVRGRGRRGRGRRGFP